MLSSLARLLPTPVIGWINVDRAMFAKTRQEQHELWQSQQNSELTIQIIQNCALF